MTRHLEHRTNNAYDTILLIEDGRVIGEWETDRNDKPFSDFQSSGDLGDWHATWPAATDPNAYGDLVNTRKDRNMKDTAEYQHNVDKFVQREVCYCVSTLIYDLVRSEHAYCNDYMGDLLAVASTLDYEGAARDDGWRFCEKSQSFVKDFVDGRTLYEFGATDWVDLCDSENIDPHEVEALEHWIVSDWLADRLEERGEMVSKNIHGLTIWGRTCSGQAISLDGVICDIFDELHG